MLIPWSDRIPKPNRGVQWSGESISLWEATKTRYLAWRPPELLNQTFTVSQPSSAYALPELTATQL